MNQYDVGRVADEGLQPRADRRLPGFAARDRLIDGQPVGRLAVQGLVVRADDGLDYVDKLGGSEGCQAAVQHGFAAHGAVLLGHRGTGRAGAAPRGDDDGCDFRHSWSVPARFPADRFTAFVAACKRRIAATRAGSFAGQGGENSAKDIAVQHLRGPSSWLNSMQ